MGCIYVVKQIRFHNSAEQVFFYQSNYSFPIGECIQNVVENDFSGLVRSSFVESKALELLSLQIKQYKDDLNSPGRQVLMRKYDVQKIVNGRDLLVEHFDDPPTIPELARQVGINQQKLKKGFKMGFGSTINQISASKASGRSKSFAGKGGIQCPGIEVTLRFKSGQQKGKVHRPCQRFYRINSRQEC